MPYHVFKQADLDYYGLTPADLNEAELRRHYRAQSLRVHPDKKDGSTSEFQKAQAVYDRLLMGLKAVRLLQQCGKVSTIFECVSYAPSRHARRQNLLQLEDTRLAPTWHPNYLLEQSWYSRDTVAHALLDISKYFHMPLFHLVESLQRLKPGEYLSADCRRGVAEHTGDGTWTYHGTSFVPLHCILREGFIGSFGAGRFDAFQKFGVDLPVVYVSPQYECAARYPLALATPQGEILGEYLADDV